MNNICTCDFHTHILPCIDDGADSVETALKLINSEIKQGVKQVCLTPHFNAKVSVDKFLEKRNASFELLQKGLAENSINDCLSFYLGAEVELDYETTKIRNLEKLCIGNSNLLLLEPPYSYWGEWILDSVFEISARYNVTPVIAHVDRYIDSKQCCNIINKMLEMNILIQLNSYNLTTPKTRSILRKLKKTYSTPFIGSDAHRPDFRDVTMNKTSSFLNKMILDKDFVNRINEQTKLLLK